MRPGIKARLALALFVLCSVVASARDWPAWRRATAQAPHGTRQLPDRLYLQWARRLPPLEPAWPDQPKLQADAVYQPVVHGKLLYVGSSRYDTLTAYELETGREAWRFHAGGPLRYAPAAWEGKVYFASDDGYLYCVDGARGSLLWKFRGGPSDRKILGNDRLISTWPARGAPAVADGTVYFAAGIWPFMGIFLHALDARTGKVIWTNDGDGSIYIRQPHNAAAFGGVAPQGTLVVAGDRLLVPGGRSVPACFDRHTGQRLYYHLAENGKRGGGCEVFSAGKFFVNGGMAYDVESGKFLGPLSGCLTAADGVLYTGGKGCTAFSLASGAVRRVPTVDRKGRRIWRTGWALEEAGRADTFDVTALAKSGGRLYLGGKGRLGALALPLKGEALVWEAPVEGTVSRLLATEDRLVAVTREGGIYCFGPGRVQPREHAPPVPPAAVEDEWVGRARDVLRTTGVRDGYCVAWGVGSGRLIEELARQSDLHVIAIDPDAARVNAFRDRLQAARIAAARVTVLAADPLTLELPPYLASLMVAENLPAPGLPIEAELLHRVFRSLRPYGGVACLPLSQNQGERLRRRVITAELPQAKVRTAGGYLLLSREGALPGAADWTHEHADAANTRVSRDTLVRAPLGLLWFGGTSHDGVLPRHGHGPQPQVQGGRAVIEGVDMIRATDVYTGRLLWQTPLPGVGTFYNNLFHQPGANAGGANYITTPDGIYVAYGKVCLRLDPATGKKVSEFRLPPLPLTPPPLPRGARGERKASPLPSGERGRGEGPGRKAPAWGYLNVAGDYLVGGADPLFNAILGKAPKGRGKDVDEDKPMGKLMKKAARAGNDSMSSSKHLVVMDRHTGKVLWGVTAENGFRHNGICIGGGRLYCIDRLSGSQLGRLRRRGEKPKLGPRLVVFDLKTGREVWQTRENIFGTWLSYSAKHDVLIEAGRVARDTMFDEPKGMRAYEAGTGKVLWSQSRYAGPAMLHGDTILMAGSACELLTGRPKMRPDPLTGRPVEWTWTRGYGCNTPAASEHLLTFRSGAAGYYDLCNDGGTGNLGGFRSSCTNNLIVADGVLCAPDYTRTCVCNYQNQTSLALIHVPDAEMWTFFSTPKVAGPLRRLGLNLGAPGARRAEDGTLWLEYPRSGGPEPAVRVTSLPARPTVVRRHSSRLKGAGPHWVMASGIKGLRSLAIDLGGSDRSRRNYTVRLHFAELEAVEKGERVFDVALQGETVLRGFDVLKEAGGRNRGVVREFKGVRAGKELVVTFAPSSTAKVGAALLNGIEILAEGP